MLFEKGAKEATLKPDSHGSGQPCLVRQNTGRLYRTRQPSFFLLKVDFSEVMAVERWPVKRRHI
jgi:uncharacterized protein YwqG